MTVKKKLVPGYYDGHGNELSDAQLHPAGIFPGRTVPSRSGAPRSQAEAVRLLSELIKGIELGTDWKKATRLMLSEALEFFGDRSIAPIRGYIWQNGQWVPPPARWTAQEAAMEHARHTGHVWWFEEEDETFCQTCGEFWTDTQFEKTSS